MTEAERVRSAIVSRVLCGDPEVTDWLVQNLADAIHNESGTERVFAERFASLLYPDPEKTK